MAVPWPPISETVPPSMPTGRRQVEQCSHRDAGQVLHKHVGDSDRKQDHQRFSARQQVLQAGIDADGGEEVNQQDIPRSQIETDFDIADKIQQRNSSENSRPPVTGSGMLNSLRNPTASLTPLADKQHDDTQCNREKSAELQNTVIEFHSDHYP